MKYIGLINTLRPSALFIFHQLTFVLSIILSVMSYAVITEKDFSDDILLQIQKDADVFVDMIMQNKIDFEKKLDWLDQLSMILKKHCRPVSNSVDIIRFTG